MTKLKLFFKVFWKSLTNPPYYQKIARAPFSFSLKYLFFLLFLVSLIEGLILSGRVLFFLPKTPELIARAKTVVKNFYPAELVVVIKNGQLQTNVKEPYFIDFPQELGVSKVHFIVIDTKAKVEDIEKYSTMALVTKDKITTVNDRGYKVYSLKDIKSDVYIDRNLYDQAIKEILPFFDYLPLAIYVLVAFLLLVWPFLGAVFGLVGKLFYLLILSPFFWVIAKVLKSELAYKKVYQISIHATTLPIVLFFVAKLLSRTSFPGVYTAALLIFMIVILMRFKNKARPKKRDS